MAREWVRVLATHEIRPGQMTFVDVDGLPVALANIGGEIYAFSDVCRHEGGPLSAGTLIGETVTCPWHGWAYSIRTGKSIVPPIGLRIPVYPTQIEDGQIFIAIDWPDA
ncbi:non-heme iron oxygenase ferredoxin subunit [Chloroflexales bacterium ZM16-3]|nr:non-heme iron oxygenase ferredoxin subunit [Chloroflexales bacterium ZM16-3]